MVKFERSFMTESQIFILMELCHNGDLEQVIRARKTLTELEIQYYMRQLIIGVHYL